MKSTTLKKPIQYLASLGLILTLAIPFAYSQDKSNSEEETVAPPATEPLSVRDAMGSLQVSEGNKDDLVITSQDSDSGLLTSYDVTNDDMKISFAYHINGNPRKAMEFTGVDFQLGAKFWPRTWILGFLQTARTKFRSVTQFNEKVPVNNGAQEDTDETLLTFGAGMGYESTYIQDFLNWEKFFETINVMAGFARMREEFQNENFSGPGIRADYGVHYRMSKISHLGLRFNYNLYSVKRAESFVDEPQSRRHLMLSWATWALDFSIYF